MKNTLHIGFDAKRLYNNFTGLGNYSRTLVWNLVEHFPDVQYHLFASKIKKNEETLDFLQHPKLVTNISEASLSSYWRSFSIKEDLKANDIQIYHGLSHEIPFGIHKTNIKSVVTIHDLVIKRYPKYFPFLDRKIYDLKFKYACQNADVVIAISESTKQDIMKYYGTPASKIKVIYQTCHERFKQKYPAETLELIRNKYQLPQQFLLYVGSIIPRKKLKEIIEALALLPKDTRLPLVVVGSGKAYKKEVQASIEKHRLTESVLFLKPKYEDLAMIYQMANLFLYPSVYEGFGIPILEALYAKIPVITAQNSSLGEAGGKGAHYVDAINPYSLSAAIEKVVSDEKYAQQLVADGQEQLTKFDSKKLSKELMEVYLGMRKE